ncbi:MAG: alkaline phosphatase PhoX [Thiobacillus sp.]
MKTFFLILVLSMISAAHAQASCCLAGPMAFHPVAGSAYGREQDADIDTAPFLIPEGFQQRVVSSGRDLNLYIGADMLDMNTVNETGAQAGRYLYRTHEVRGSNAARVDGGNGGAVSVVDLKSGKAKELVGRVEWEGLDGIVWTPWQTLLVTEETSTRKRPNPDAPHATSGLVYEIQLKRNDPSSAKRVDVRPLLGAMAHEGIDVDPQGNVYVIDENRRGSIYQFVPDHFGDLSSGQLHVLKVLNPTKTGDAAWVALDRAQTQVSARVAARALAATEYCRPEDIERIGDTLYVALTCEDVNDPTHTDGPGAILAVDLGSKPATRFVVAPGKNVPVEVKPAADFDADARPAMTGFNSPDNLASGPDGTLWIVEDNAWSDIWVYDPRAKDTNGDGYQDGVHLFASLKDKHAEGSGLYFDPDFRTLYVNVQHSGTGHDKTLAISRQRQD